MRQKSKDQESDSSLYNMIRLYLISILLMVVYYALMITIPNYFNSLNIALILGALTFCIIIFKQCIIIYKVLKNEFYIGKVISYRPNRKYFNDENEDNYSGFNYLVDIEMNFDGDIRKFEVRSSLFKRPLVNQEVKVILNNNNLSKSIIIEKYTVLMSMIFIFILTASIILGFIIRSSTEILD